MLTIYHKSVWNASGKSVAFSVASAFSDNETLENIEDFGVSAPRSQREGRRSESALLHHSKSGFPPNKIKGPTHIGVC